MSHRARFLLALFALASLAHATPTGGGFAAGDIWMNAQAALGLPSGGLVRIEPLTGVPHMVLPWLSSNAASEQTDAFCYDPVRDRILVMGALDSQPQAIWAVDAAGNHSKLATTIGGIVSMAPSPGGKVYVALAIISSTSVGVLGWLDSAGVYHPLLDPTGTFPFQVFDQAVQVFNASVVYDPGSNSLVYAVSHAGVFCKTLGGGSKGAIYRIPLSADGTRGLSESCELYDIDGGYPLGTGGGIPRGFSRAPGGAYMLVLNGNGATGSMDEAAPRMKLVTPLLNMSTFASNGPYTNAAWSTGGIYSWVRHQAVIFDGANNRLRAYDLGEFGDGDQLAVGLVGGSFIQERAGLIEVQPFTSAEGSLTGTPAQLSIATGGSQTLDVDFGPGLAGKIYLVLGSASGFNPGFALKGHDIPLNMDAYTQITLQNPNSFLLINSFGVLDTAGKAQAQFNLPPGAPPSLAGLVIHHAALAAQGGSQILGVTNAAPVTLVP